MGVTLVVGHAGQPLCGQRAEGPRVSRGLFREHLCTQQGGEQFKRRDGPEWLA